jgi:HAD superfamily hydrolase (TIGR01509 family)
MIRVLIFDWGDTIMRDFPGLQGPMATWEHVEWIPGAREALEVLSKKYICAIATNAGASDTGWMREALRRIDAEKYFTHFFSSKDLGAEKPDPDFFRRIASAIGADPEQCLHIGNLYAKDISGAKQAGMYTVFFNEKGSNDRFPHADSIIMHMNELTDAVSRLDQSGQDISG